MHVYNTKKEIMLLSYIDKKSDKKNLIVLSTIHYNVKITKDQQKKLSVHTMCGHMKGGIDITDLLSTTHSTQIKSRRCPLNTLALILDTCLSNVKTTLQDNGIKLINFEMTYNLGKKLAFPAIRRYSQSNGLKITLINKIRRALESTRYRLAPNLRISTQHLVHASNLRKLLLVRNLKRLKGRNWAISWKQNVRNAKSLYIKSTKQNCNLSVKIVLSNKTLL